MALMAQLHQWFLYKTMSASYSFPEVVAGGKGSGRYQKVREKLMNILKEENGVASLGSYFHTDH